MKRTFFALLFGFVAFQAAASAETLTGTVLTVDANTKMITVSPIENTADFPAQVDIQLKEDAEFRGEAQSLDQIQPGQTVRLDAEENMDTSKWEAKSVEVEQSGVLSSSPSNALGARSNQNSSQSASQPVVSANGSPLPATSSINSQSSSGISGSNSSSFESSSSATPSDASVGTTQSSMGSSGIGSSGAASSSGSAGAGSSSGAGAAGSGSAASSM